MARAGDITPLVLVTGASGKQGGAAARALRERGVPVRALVRDLDSSGAQALEALGVELTQGDLDDVGSIEAAVEGVQAVFSVPLPDPAVPDAERTRGRNLVNAALESGVAQFVHSSLSGAGAYHRDAAGWAEGRWNVEYWESKAYVQELVRDAGFDRWAVLQPAFFMENFIRPSIFFVNWIENRLLTVLTPTTKVALTAVADIGTAVAAVVGDPAKYDRQVIPLDFLPVSDIAATLSSAWAEEIAAPSMSVDDLLAHPLPGLPPEVMQGLANMQEWMNEVGHPARPEDAAALGLQTTTLAAWAHTARARA